MRLIKLSKFCDAIDQRRYIGAKFLFDSLDFDVCVFYHIMEQCCCYRCRVTSNIEQNDGDSNRMRKVSLSAHPLLITMCVLRKIPGLRDEVFIKSGNLVSDLIKKPLLRKK